MACGRALDIPLKDQEWSNLVRSIGAAVQQDLSVQEFANSLGLSRGVTGYVYHSPENLKLGST